jgi:hypothetical protein
LCVFLLFCKVLRNLFFTISHGYPMVCPRPPRLEIGRIHAEENRR